MRGKIREAISSDFMKLQQYYKEFDNFFETSSSFSKIMVYELENAIVGFIQYNIIYERVELDYIYVEKDWRKRGIASQLMNFCLQDSIKNSCLNITLEVNENNTGGIKLYEKFGFQRVAIRPRYYHGKNALLMMRELKKSE